MSIQVQHFVNEKTATAIHESGHAVMALLLNLRITDVVVRSNGTGLMRGATGHPFHDCLVSVAGPIAEGIYRDAKPADEHQEIVKALEQLRVACPGAADAMMVGATRRAERILHNHWPAVEAIAAELERKGRLTEEQVWKVFSRSRSAVG